MTVVRRFGEVLRPPGVRTAVLAGLFARLSVAMTGLAVLLLVKGSTGSYGDAGLVSASYALALALVAPFRARSADRRGATPVLRLSAALHPLAFLLLVVLATRGAPVPLDAAAAVLVGATVPPVSGVMRALWGVVVEPALLPVAYSLEAVSVELCFVVGPLLVALVATLAPAAAVLVSAAFATAGALVMASVPVVRTQVPEPERSSHVAGPLVSPVVRASLLCVLFIGIAFGATEVGVLAFVEEHGHPRSTAGAVLALWAAGSAVGGLVYGGLHLRSDPARQLPLLVSMAGAACSFPLLAPGTVALALLLLLAGCTIAPWNAVNSVVVARAAPPGTTTEAFAWFGTLMFAGGSVGTGLSGLLADTHGSRGAFSVASVAGVLAVGAALLAVRVLNVRAEGSAPVAS